LVLASVLELSAPARSGDEDGFGAMEKAIQQRRSEYAVVVEGLGPFFELAVGGEDGRAALVALGDDLEKAVGSLLCVLPALV